ncbi:MAG: GAP family protein [Actinomycetota bacterium]|nr:GAP family protein [Actinomycetota bacterium]
MIRLIGIAISIGLADSLNPTTVAPALYLATGQRARKRVTEFTIGVLVVSLVGGIAIALGPGQLLLSLIPHPKHHVAHGIEVVAGVAMIIGAIYLWRNRERLSHRDVPEFNPTGKSSWLLGATIAALELPTAFPYFAVIAAVVGADIEAPRQILVLVIFNVCFILPQIGIIAILTVAGDSATKVLRSIRDYLQRRWPVLVSGLALVAGIFVVLLGATGFGESLHGSLGRFSRHIRHVLHP